MRSLTLDPTGKEIEGEITSYGGFFGSHLSERIATERPSPTLQPAPESTTYLACKRIFHAYEPLSELSHYIIEQSGKNFALKTLWNREFSQVFNLHICLASKESLNLFSSLKPIPPSFFGRHSVPQLIQWIFRCSPLYPHQNFLIKDSMSCTKHFGSLKEDIVYVGIACITALIKTSCPAWDSSFSF